MRLLQLCMSGKEAAYADHKIYEKNAACKEKSKVERSISIKMSDLMKVSSNPHIRSKTSTSGIMLAVIIALLPAAGFGIYNFGLDALILILVTVLSTVLTEYIFVQLFQGTDVPVLPAENVLNPAVQALEILIGGEILIQKLRQAEIGSIVHLCSPPAVVCP